MSCSDATGVHIRGEEFKPARVLLSDALAGRIDGLDSVRTPSRRHCQRGDPGDASRLKSVDAAKFEALQAGTLAEDTRRAAPNVGPTK